MHSLKNFNRKENTMQYMTNQMLQRFMSHMADALAAIQESREYTEENIALAKKEGYKEFLEADYYWRGVYKKCYVRNSALQAHVKRGSIEHRILQKMEKVVTLWINHQQREEQYAYEGYLDNRYDPFYRNRSKQAKQKLAKLVELQQAIRKQKSVTKF